MIDEVPVITPIQNRFYKEILEERYDKILKPVYSMLIKKLQKKDVEMKR